MQAALGDRRLEGENMDEELLELLAACVQARIHREEAWKDIPKNCPFYEMAPEKYDHY